MITTKDLKIGDVFKLRENLVEKATSETPRYITIQIVWTNGSAAVRGLDINIYDTLSIAMLDNLYEKSSLEEWVYYRDHQPRKEKNIQQ